LSEYLSRRVGDVAGVADGRLANRLAVVADGFHRHLHVRQVVERVEDPEDVHAGVRRVLDEAGDDVVRIVRIADGVRAAEEHLETDVRDLFAQAAEAVPRAFAEEAHRGVEGRSAPHFQREKLGRAVGDRLGHAQHVEAAHAGGDERLVGVAQGGVGDQQALFVENPLREFLRAEVQQHVAAAFGDFGVVLDDERVRHDRLVQHGPGFPAFGGRVAVESDVG
jgi:hypothetical protein